MTTTTTTPSGPRTAAVDRDTATRLAATEYDRFVELLRSLRPDDWERPTECLPWTVRDMAAHALGMVEMAASMREQLRQQRAASARWKEHGGQFVDALTAVQVDARAGLSPQQLVARYAARAPRAVKGRRRVPRLLRRRPLPLPEMVNGQPEPWALGYLLDIILTRDPWMHRIDIVRATGAEHVLTAEHDGVLVADVVAEWGGRHGQPYRLHLTGPAGGTWSSGSGGVELELDAVEFCRILSGRAAGTGLLATQVPF